MCEEPERARRSTQDDDVKDPMRYFAENNDTSKHLGPKVVPAFRRSSRSAPDQEGSGHPLSSFRDFDGKELLRTEGSEGDSVLTARDFQLSSPVMRVRHDNIFTLHKPELCFKLKLISV